jgi:nucleotide-binding universal stress UspA family protein
VVFLALKMRAMYGSIVVGTDGSDTAKEAVRQAAELAKAVGASVLLVSAYEPVPESRLRQERTEVPTDVSWMVNPREDVQAVLDEEAERVRENGVSEVETFAREGDPADAILDVAEEKKADLIVVGNKGMTGARRFLLGSVPNKVSHHAPCNVMIVRTT